MAQSGYTPIQLYYSTTASAVPLAANLNAGELAINTNDGKLYYKSSAGVVTLLAGAGGTGIVAGSNTQLQFNNSGVFGASANLTWSGTVLATTGLTATGAILHNTTTNNQSYTTTGAGTITISSGTTGTIDGMNIGATTAGTGKFTSITNSGLTTGRVVYTTTGGLETSSANLTFDGTTLTANTIGAFTLSGTIAGGGNQINNIIIGTSTPLAGTFTTLTATELTSLAKTVTIGSGAFNGSAVFAAATPAKLYISTGTVTDTTSAIGATNTTGVITSLGITPIAATNTSVTYTNASTLYIAGAPSAGTNVTITNPYSLYVNAGSAYFGGGVSLTSITDSGNLTFTGTGNRITGDFSNATFSSRVAFQTSTTNGNTSVSFLPNGTALAANLVVYNNQDPTNSAFNQFAVDGTSAYLSSSIRGTGTYLPLVFQTSGSTKITIAADTTGTITIGGTAPRITGDMSNATYASRVLFQTSTTNGASSIGVIPNGTGVNASLFLDSDSAATNSSRVAFQMLGGSEARLSSTILGTGTYLPMTFYTGGSERMRLDTSGNVGIGTSSPITTSARLSVKAIGDYDAGLAIGSNASAANWARLDFKNTNVAYSGIIYQDQGGLFNMRNDGAQGIAFSTNGGNERMRIDSSGNVGIGTNSPSSFAKFVVLQTSGSNAIQLATTTNGAGIYWNLTNAGGILDYSYGSYRISGTSDSQPYLFATNSAEKARLSASGDFLVTGTGTGGLGYGTGSGGTVTQATSKSTGVTLNKPTGQITMNNAALLPSTSVVFVLSNSLLAASDSVIVQPNYGTNSQAYTAQVTFAGAGGVHIRVTNITAGSLSEAVTLSFAIIKGATS